ncbi:MAG: hypothetical protein LW627_03625 [Ilumatobacteraceae bacterium]|nr:hypothetical protein [Ilumatobacteraceae bacterium]
MDTTIIAPGVSHNIPAPSDAHRSACSDFTSRRIDRMTWNITNADTAHHRLVSNFSGTTRAPNNMVNGANT